MRLVTAGIGQQAQIIRLGGVGDPHFGAVDDVVVSVFYSGGFNIGHI